MRLPLVLSQIALGLVEQVVANATHECGHSKEDWRGICVTILFSDDYLLYSIRNSGATNIPQINNTNANWLHDMTQYQGGLQATNLE
jgi:hypothetical protein